MKRKVSLSLRSFASLLVFAAAVPAASLVASDALAEGPAAAAPAKGPTAEEIGKRVQAFYDSSKTFKATFTQQVDGQLYLVLKSPG